MVTAALKALRRFKWSQVPKRRRQFAYVSVLAVSVTATLEYKFQECIEIVGNPAGITSPHTLFWLRVLFGRMRSRWVGAVADAQLPVTLRAPLYRLFAWQYGADLEEIRYPLESFRSFNDFFSRALREGARPIAQVPQGLVSPVDGRVLASGIVEGTRARIEQVKGATYSVPGFLGLDPVELAGPASTVQYVVLYLAPGDYHRIHSPCQVRFTQGRHFCGELLPVRVGLLKRVSDIFSVNERVVLSGQWCHGQMHLAAVAAANVGNIFLDFDSKLKTNRLRDIAVHCGGDVSRKLYPDGVELPPGGAVGGFRLGSTVVLVFEAPRTFRFKVSLGEKVRVGQPLGDVE